MKKDSRIYVAGHTGLVGSAIYRRLVAGGYEKIITVPRSRLDLRRQQDTERFFEEERPEYVFFAAAKVGGIIANNNYRADFIYDNLAIAVNMIDSAFKYGVKKLLNLGSSCIYPRSSPQPMKEEHLLTGSLEPTNEPYAVAKIAAIKLCRYYNDHHGTNFISVMPSNLFGPNDNFSLETGHLPPALIRKFHLAKLLKDRDLVGLKNDLKRAPLGFGIDRDSNMENAAFIKEALKTLGISDRHVTLWGSGTPLREFLYVDDLSDACVFLMERYNYQDIGEIVNIGSDSELSIRDMAKLVRGVIGYDGEIRNDATKPDGMTRKLLDVTKMNLLGWKPRVPLEEGLKRTYEWYTLGSHESLRAVLPSTSMEFAIPTQGGIREKGLGSMIPRTEWRRGSRADTLLPAAG